MNIVLFGPPGAGKGTQADNLVKNLGLHKISTGDLLRDEVKKKSLLGIKIKTIIDKGEFVPDDIINSFIDKIISNKKNLKSIGKLPRAKSSGNYIGIMRIPKKRMLIFKKFLINAKNKNKKHYFTEVLNDLIQFREKINIIDIAPNFWTEIDNMNDLKKAIKNKNKLDV